MSQSKSVGGIASPPLGTLDDDDEVDGAGAVFDGLKRGGRIAKPPLDESARQLLRKSAESSPLVTTRSHRPPTPAFVEPKAEKVVRDGYSIPREDHELLGRLAETAMRQGRNIGKSGIIRLGIRLLAGLPEDQLIELTSRLPRVPTAKRRH